MYKTEVLSIQETPQAINDSLRSPCTESGWENGAFIDRVRLEREIEHYLKLVGRRKQPVLHRLPVKNSQDTTKLAKSLKFLFAREIHKVSVQTDKWRDRWDHSECETPSYLVLPVRNQPPVIHSKIFEAFLPGNPSFFNVEGGNPKSIHSLGDHLSLKVLNFGTSRLGGFMEQWGSECAIPSW